jgi:DNA-directed RNA polymerase specialized sigma24 family protein
MMARWEEFRRPNGAREWIALSRKIMRDASVDEVRERHRHGGQSLPAELIDHRASDPASQAEAKDQCEWVIASLKELSHECPDYAWMLREHFLKGRPIKELADERGTTEHAAHCRMTRALKALHRLMSECRPDGEAAP